MIVRDPRASWKYVLLADRKLPRDQQTVFELRHLSLLDESRLMDNLDRDSSGMPIRKDLGTERLNLLRRHLSGWANLRRADGTTVQYETTLAGAVKDDLLFLLDVGQRTELALALENEIAFDPDEVGKSEPEST